MNGGDRYPEKLYFGRTSRPHCPTCVCPDTNGYKNRTYQPSSPSRQQQRGRHRRPLEDEGAEDDGSDEDFGFRRGQEERVDRVRMARPPDHHGHRKTGLLERWFERFDFNNDDVLDLYELRCLFKSLGIMLSEDYCQSLLDSSDCDGDGRLSFPEFLMMWYTAQSNDELADVITEYALFSGVERDYSRRRHREVRGDEEDPQPFPRSAQETRRIRTTREDGVVHESEDPFESYPSSLRSHRCNGTVKEIECVTMHRMRANKNNRM